MAESGPFIIRDQTILHDGWGSSTFTIGEVLQGVSEAPSLALKTVIDTECTHR